MIKISRGDILLINLDPTLGSEIKKTRPCVVISNDINNTYSRLISVVPVTTKNVDRVYPFETRLEKGSGIHKLSKALCDQIRTIDKKRVVRVLGSVSGTKMKAIESSLRLHLGI